MRIELDLTPWDVFRALEALRGSRGYVAMHVADSLEVAAREQGYNLTSDGTLKERA